MGGRRGMNEQDPKILNTLEFPTIRELLKSYCASALGRGIADRLMPFIERERAIRALIQVTEMRFFLAEEGRLTFTGAGDAVAVIRKASETSRPIEPGDLYHVGRLLTCAHGIRDTFIQDREDDDESVESRYRELSRLASRIHDLEELEAEIVRTVDGESGVSSSASPRLAGIRERRDQLASEIRRSAERYLSRREVNRHLQEPTVMIRNGRMVLPVRVESRGRVKGILHDYSASGNTVFIEPEGLVEKQNALEKLKSRERREVTRILWERTRRLLEESDRIRDNQRIVAWMDFTRARARYAEDYEMQAPRLGERERLVLRGARHPLLLHMAHQRAGDDPDERRRRARDEVVPIDLHLGDRFDMLVITGPNTGGKTVTLKTAGLLALMAASGLHVPAEEGTVIPFYRAVLADIGDEQDISQSLSTFSSHVKRISRILTSSDEMTLVLLDELGSGTDPQEGEALGRALLRYLLDRRCNVLVSTHLSKLKELAFTSPRVENGSVEFDPDSLSPTFRLRIGIPGESNALRIARRLGLPHEILDEAERCLDPKGGDLKALMDEVQRIRLEAETSLETSKREARAARQSRERAEDHEEEMAVRKDQVGAEAEREIDRQLRAGRDRALSVLNRLKSLPDPHKAHILELEEVLLDLVERSPLGEKRRRFVEQLKKGDLVYIPRYKEKCRVIRIHRKEDAVEVAYRSLSVKVPSEEVMWPHWF